jgi:hypothetical protein
MVFRGIAKQISKVVGDIGEIRDAGTHQGTTISKLSFTMKVWIN